MALVYLPEKTWSPRYGPEFFTVAIIGVDIHERTYARYKIMIQNGKKHWTLLRRFSEFDKMRSSVQSKKGRDIPPLPPKTFWCRDLNPEYLVRRKALLYEFLNDLLVIPHVTEENGVRDFLQLQSSKTFFV
ncbi:hypothetical protein Poli38472_003868 [Pythium oligandrum]|uniref:PX domain-containing protein n=1 Tax=Pythium oligandrum TaxID=41045 RepID=A0A8K1FPZ2_PYTOL|nr:hypothetical protein Poli38472_003868 [Pythium oligandrum]|eukprot:TMW66103.1 hypothetical protein Poli38472_003868 [Pythium oligandrum]